MHSHQTYIREYKGTTEEHILNRIQLWDAISLFLEEYTYFLKNKNKNTFISENKYNTIIICINYITYIFFLENAIMGTAS